jgi:hypothetical protein
VQQPQWITPTGSLGTIPENVFYKISLQASAGDENVFFRLIAGQLPAGIQVTANGNIEGVPRNVINVQGIPQEVSEDVTSRFAVRAYTRRLVNGQFVVNRIADRTFEITVTGQSIPEFVTPPGNIGTFYDGTEVNLQIDFTDSDPDDSVTIQVSSGELPPGLVLDPRTGRISGIISPLIGPPNTAEPGWDSTPFDQYPFDFTLRAASKNYQFTLAITDGKDTNLRTFTIFVYAKNTLSADNTDITADNTFITADATPPRSPILLTPAGDIGVIRADNYFAFQFKGLDFDGDALEYSVTTGSGLGFDPLPRSDSFNFEPGSYDYFGQGFDQGPFALPPGLQIDPDTGWFYGYIPDQGATEFTYRFAVKVRKRDQPLFESPETFFTLTILGDLGTEVRWLTPQDLGYIDNGGISELSVEAFNVGGRALQYRIASGTASKLPQGLTLLSSGNIVGRVSFNTFALDGGTTTFDRNPETRLAQQETTFDLEFNFTVNAFASESQQIGYGVSAIVVADGGTGYTSQPIVSISPPENTINGIQATAGVVTIVDGVITNIALGNPGRGYVSTPIVSISGGGGSGAMAVAQIREVEITNPVSVFRRFTVRVRRRFNQPYETLYIKAMPPQQDRDLLKSLLENQDLIPLNLVYRKDDPNFGVASSVIYNHAYGLTASSLADYVSALELNHYLKNLTLGTISTAEARDELGNVVYEVIYSNVIDDLVNAQGQSVGKQVPWPVPIEVNNQPINTVYPNSLINMRDQVIDTVGQISPALPRWMTSKQQDGRVLGFQPAWVIAYVKPGTSGRIVYNILRSFGESLNVIDFEVDRYTLDRSQTLNWDPEEDQWIPSPASATTFDLTDIPPQLNFLEKVDYVTRLPFVDINQKTLDYIASRGGIDGDIGRQVNNRTLIFGKQEGFGEQLTPDQAFTRYAEPPGYDETPYDSLPYNFDSGEIIPRPERLWIYKISVDSNNLVTLTAQRPAVTLDYVVIERGSTARNNQLYIPNAPTPGLLFISWTEIPDRPVTPTIFDGNDTRFIAPADRWQPSDRFDKYLMFPKRTILG